MEIVVVETYEAICRETAARVARLMRNKPDCVLGLPTGSTPIGFYKELVRLHREESLDFSKVYTFNLDEYLGLDSAHDQSYHYYMRKSLFVHVNVSADRAHIPQGTADDPAAFCAWYERRIQECGGIDLMVLGIGSNAHIAFNEPGSSLGSRTRVAPLSRQTRQDNALLFGGLDSVPVAALSVGIGTISEARQILLMASGPGKAAAIRATVEGPVTAKVPASILQFHPDTTLLLDPAAASLLTPVE